MSQTVYSELKKLFSLADIITSLEKKVGSFDAQFSKIRHDIGDLSKRVSQLGSSPTGKLPSARKSAREGQPSLQSVVASILKMKKGPMKIKEIEEAILKGKLYISGSKNFRENLRVMIYTNRKKLFKKVGPGMFTLTSSKGPVKGTKMEKAPREAKQLTLVGAIQAVMEKKKSPMSVKEIEEAIVKAKIYKTNSQNLSKMVQVNLYRNTKNRFAKVKPGLFALAPSKETKSAAKKKATPKKKGAKPVAKKKRGATRRVAKKAKK